MGCSGHQDDRHPGHGAGGRGRFERGLLHGDLRRGRPAGVRSGPARRLPHHRDVVPAGRVRVPVPHSHDHEERRDENGQTRKADGSDRDIFRSVHGAGDDCDSLLLLRAVVPGAVDRHLARHAVPEQLHHDLPPPRHRQNQTLARLQRLHDQVSDDRHRRDHLGGVDLDRENLPVVEAVLLSDFFTSSE